MDLAYDHIQEDAYIKNPEESGSSSKQEQAQSAQSSINSDIQEAYKAFSASPWGAKIGGFFGSVVKQGESVYNQASKELAEVSEDATKGFTSLRETIINRTRSLSLTTVIPEASRDKDAEDNQTTPTNTKEPSSEETATAEESETVLSRLRSEAAKRLKDLQRAEDAADEALLRFGGNIRDFLRDAISIAPPDESTQGSQVLFESKDAQGKRVIHSSRFDAQLHVIHTSTESFTKDPTGTEYEQWTKDFDVEKKTGDISNDLSKYPELRSTMEKLVPDQIPYAEFWQRYYFLRHGIETAESRRRDLLKAASAEDEVGWDDDSEEENEPEKSEKPAAAVKRRESVASTTTIQPKNLKPSEPRKSNDEKSEADTEASYDVVGAASGKTSQAPSKAPSQAPSQAPNSPQDPKKKEDDSDEDSDDEEESEEEDEEDSDEDSDEDWE